MEAPDDQVGTHFQALGEGVLVLIVQAFFYHAFSEDEVGFCLWYIEFLAKFLEFF